MSTAFLITTLVILATPGTGVIYTLAVAYLLYMAWSTLRETGALTVDEEIAPPSDARVIASGVLINILNPKLTIFFFAFLPQFVSVDQSGAWVHMVGLSGVFMAVTFVVSPSTGCSPPRLAPASPHARG